MIGRRGADAKECADSPRELPSILGAGVDRPTRDSSGSNKRDSIVLSVYVLVY